MDAQSVPEPEKSSPIPKLQRIGLLGFQTMRGLVSARLTEDSSKLINTQTYNKEIIMQDTLVSNEVPMALEMPAEPEAAPMRVPGNYRQRLENAKYNLGALAGRRGGRKSVGIPVAWVNDPVTGDTVRILVGTPPRERMKDKTSAGLLKYEAAAAKRKRKKRLRINNALLSGAPIVGYRDGFQR